MWSRVAYVVACIVLPVAWGLVVLWASNRIEAAVRVHGKHHKSDTVSTTPEYHI